MTWRDKAHRLIAAACLASYRQANPVPGRKHRPYTVPDVAQDLVDCLNKDDEHRAKAIFLSHDGMQLIQKGDSHVQAKA